MRTISEIIKILKAGDCDCIACTGVSCGTNETCLINDIISYLECHEYNINRIKKPETGDE